VLETVASADSQVKTQELEQNTLTLLQKVAKNDNGITAS
jgi:hypothetical protein